MPAEPPDASAQEPDTAADAAAGTEPAPPSLCPGPWSDPETAADLDTDALPELSGLVASAVNPGIFWAHNDSGDGPILHAIDGLGRHRAALTVGRDYPLDWEDIARATCPDGSGPCLWVGDIGDNPHLRPEVWLWVVPEPVLDPGVETLVELDAATRWILPFTYPNGPVDSEALLVAVDGQSVALFEKVDEDQARIFAAGGPFGEAEPTALDEVGALASPGLPVSFGRMITGADLHPSGAQIALRVYTGSYVYPLASARNSACSARSRSPSGPSTRSRARPSLGTRSGSTSGPSRSTLAGSSPCIVMCALRETRLRADPKRAAPPPAARRRGLRWRHAVRRPRAPRADGGVSLPRAEGARPRASVRLRRAAPRPSALVRRG